MIRCCWLQEVWRGGRHAVNWLWLPCTAVRGSVGFRCRWLSPKRRKRKTTKKRKYNFCSSFFLLTGIYVLEGLHKNLTDSVSVSVLSVGKACPCTGIMLTSLCLWVLGKANKSLRVAERVGSISAVNNVASCWQIKRRQKIIWIQAKMWVTIG